MPMNRAFRAAKANHVPAIFAAAAGVILLGGCRNVVVWWWCIDGCYCYKPLLVIAVY